MYDNVVSWAGDVAASVNDFTSDLGTRALNGLKSLTPGLYSWLNEDTGNVEGLNVVSNGLGGLTYQQFVAEYSNGQLETVRIKRSGTATDSDVFENEIVVTAESDGNHQIRIRSEERSEGKECGRKFK